MFLLNLLKTNGISDLSSMKETTLNQMEIFNFKGTHNPVPSITICNDGSPLSGILLQK